VSPLVKFPRGPKQPLRHVERLDITPPDIVRRSSILIVGTGEPRQTIEQDQDLASSLRDPLGPVHGELCKPDVLFGRVV